ncbi:MAG: TlpA family protein disulfide reductase [Planctomycetes bacterium]|nr:TlpA family protein disulfide reductase [Planctomycetota bacterium]
MRKVLVLAAMAGLIGPAGAEDAKLKVGDKAPPVKAARWWQGKEVKSFDAGKVYVVEFWATWCGPCIVMMPHMGALQSQYKDKGVTFVGFTAKDERGNNLEKVQAFVEKRAPKLGYTFAYADDRETYDAWMKAAGRAGIPCCFVVDGAGKVAYIGHPMYLDVVLPKVVEGKWTADDLKGIAAIEKDVDGVFKALLDPKADPETGLKTLAEFEKKYPPLAHIPYFVAPKIGAMIRAKKLDEAKKAAEEVIARAVQQEDAGALQSLSFTLRLPDAKGAKEALALSLTAAEAALKLTGEKDPFALFMVAEAHFANGDVARAKDLGSKAVAVADNEGLKKLLQAEIKKYDDKK